MLQTIVEGDFVTFLFEYMWRDFCTEVSAADSMCGSLPWWPWCDARCLRVVGSVSSGERSSGGCHHVLSG